MTRKQLLQSLLAFNAPVANVMEPLKKFGWDSETELVTLTRDDIASVLKRYLSSELSASDVEDWANALEIRDDVGYEVGYEDLLSDVVFDLANPALNGLLNLKVAQELIARLS
jgi:hypothetical protein